jgi:hypothetical protein
MTHRASQAKQAAIAMCTCSMKLYSIILISKLLVPSSGIEKPLEIKEFFEERVELENFNIFVKNENSVGEVIEKSSLLDQPDAP